MRSKPIGSPILGLLGTLVVALLLGSAGPATSRPSDVERAAQTADRSGFTGPGDEDEHLRTCADSVYGDLGRNWRRHSVVVGPVAFINARLYESEPQRSFRRTRFGYPVTKLLLAVQTGALVRVSVPREHRFDVSLMYDPSRFERRGYAIRDGDRSVVFVACANSAGGADQGRTQFNGGLILRGPRCITLRVTTPIDGTSRRAELSFGAGDC